VHAPARFAGEIELPGSGRAQPVRIVEATA
jgi:hypothetical protein